MYILAVAAIGVPATAQDRPEPVPRLTERALDKASYAELARQWKAYIEEYGETAGALVNLGMAYDYGDEHDAATVAARRAVELEPDNPRALEFLGKMVLTIGDDENEALEILEHCREVAPDYAPALRTLCATYLRLGEFGEARDVMKTVFDQRLISRPLQDYAYNMLVGLPEGAVLITAGDNDTFPPLALQAGMDFRTDVIIANRSLLNVPEYAEAIFQRHPDIRPDYNIEKHEIKMVDGRPTLLSYALIDALIAERKAPVYVTASALGPPPNPEPEGHMEGINLCTGKRAMSAEESAQLFLTTYRLDSTTDWSFAWSLVPSEAKLLQNYGIAALRLVRDERLSKDTKKRLLDTVEAIAEFHDHDKIVVQARSLRKE
jgi:tetratricopeptide (TPR) repeat protein